VSAGAWHEVAHEPTSGALWARMIHDVDLINSECSCDGHSSDNPRRCAWRCDADCLNKKRHQSGALSVAVVCSRGCERLHQRDPHWRLEHGAHTAKRKVPDNDDDMAVIGASM
jgi:hypothetical protein